MHQHQDQQRHQSRSSDQLPAERDGRTPRPRGLDEWQSSIDSAIDDGIRDGQFDNLPGHGKPIKLETNPWEPEIDAAYSQLKNAGYAPTWMELDREITLRGKDLEQSLLRSATDLQDLVAELARTIGQSDEPGATPAVAIPWWKIAARLRYLIAPAAELSSALRQAPITLTDIVRIRENARDLYLESAAALDRKIQNFHGALPRNLWHLERMSLPPERAMRQFDEAIPPIVSG